MKEFPLVSIIIPCYNDVEYIEESITSALGQDYENKEIIVIDDGSNINTKLKLKELESNINKLIIQDNKGASSARNNGILQASGEFILTLDSDDFFEPSFCLKAIEVFRSNSKVRIVSSFVNRFGMGKTDILMHDNAGLKDFLKFNHSTGSAMFRRIDWEKCGGYDEKMACGYEDWEFYIRLLSMGGISHIIPEALLNYRIKKLSISSKADTIKYELLKYIYFKHKDLYTQHFEDFVSHLLGRLEIVEKAERKNLKKIEFRIGHAILVPFRRVRNLMKF